MRKDDRLFGFVVSILVIVFEIGYWIQLTKANEATSPRETQLVVLQQAESGSVD